tara:strand:+ start:374 stop:763 length:390 start_codon:yes stop_codon:yes gene_type:complete
MQKPASNFLLNFVRSSGALKRVVEGNIQDKENAYYLFVNDWDEVSKVLLNRLMDSSLDVTHPKGTVNIINTFDVPNGLNIIRESIQSFRETITLAPLKSYSKIPMMVVLHKAFPRVVDYNGSLFVELGV